MALLDCLEHTPGGSVRGSVIWLHGLGASGYDFAPLVPHMGLDGVRYVFPHAPQASEELLLVNDLDPELLGLGELAAGAGTCHQEVGLFAH